MDEKYPIFLTIREFKAEEVANWILYSPNSGIPNIVKIKDEYVRINKNHEISDKQGGIKYHIIIEMRMKYDVLQALGLYGAFPFHYCWDEEEMYGMNIAKFDVLPTENGCQVLGEARYLIDLFKKMEEELKRVSQKEIYEHLINQQILDKKQSTKRPRGRRHFADDVWAHNEIFKNKRDAASVYKEWLERPGVVERDLSEPRRHFSRIKNPDWLDNNDENDVID